MTFPWNTTLTIPQTDVLIAHRAKGHVRAFKYAAREFRMSHDEIVAFLKRHASEIERAKGKA
jgi:hypothetical protein